MWLSDFSLACVLAASEIGSVFLGGSFATVGFIDPDPVICFYLRDRTGSAEWDFKEYPKWISPF